MSQGKVVLFATQKGGTGKTTTCISLAHAMSYHFGKKVAIVDSDEQATALSFYSQRKITANEPELHGVNLGFPEVAKITSGSPYRRQLERIREFYDVILIDTKGEFDQFQHDLVRMSDYVISPVQASEFDVIPTKLVRDAVSHENGQREESERLLLSYVISKANLQANSTRHIARMIRDEMHSEVLEPFIPAVDLIASASGLGLTVIDVAEHTNACKQVINKRRADGEKSSVDKTQITEIAKIYKQLAHAVLTRLELL